MRLAITLLLSITLLHTAFGQRQFKKAEKLLSLKAFDLAIKNYEEALAQYPAHAEGYAQLGQAYFMTNQLLESLKAFERAFSLDDQLSPHYKLQYGMALKKVGLYDKSESVFFDYSTEDDAMASHQLASIDYAKSLLQQPDKYDVLSFEANSDKSDFGMSFYK
ncbi:MAG: hypothetical protein AAFQ02_12655, partial [Bacteroidota bacterium]